MSFAGGGTDLPHWYNEHQGVVFSSTIDRYAYVTLYPRNDGLIRIRSLDLGLNISFNVNNPPTYDGMLDLAKAVIYRLHGGAWSSMCVRRRFLAAAWEDRRR